MSRGAKIGIWILVLAAVVVVFVITGARRLQKEEVQSIESVQEREGVPVDVVQSQTLHVEDWREFAGIAEGFDQVDLIAPARTQVHGVYAAVGDEVPAGAILISLDPYDPSVFAMNLRTAESQYRTVRQDSIRLEALLRSGAVSEQDMDHARAATLAARAQYLTARRAVELDTPISGVVTAINVEGGDYAAGEQTLATVASYDRVRVRLEMSGSERSLVEVGQPVRVGLGKDASRSRGCSPGSGSLPSENRGNGMLTGTVTRAALSADPGTRLFLVEVVVENPDHRLRPGTLVTPTIRVGSTDDEPVIPPAAIMRHNGREYVYVVEGTGENMTARARDIVRGVENGALVAIPDGLSAGDRVVVWGQSNLEDGVKVKIHEDRTGEYFENRARR
jgi:RND family efflux transporter MFP subunit